MEHDDCICQECLLRRQGDRLARLEQENTKLRAQVEEYRKAAQEVLDWDGSDGMAGLESRIQRLRAALKEGE